MNDDMDQVRIEAVLSIPLRETITHVLTAFEGTGISSNHLAAQIESQVRSWIRHSLHI